MLIVFLSQVGFLTEWQLYAQKLEGDQWVGERMDPNKIDKMSGKLIWPGFFQGAMMLTSPSPCRSADWTDV